MVLLFLCLCGEEYTHCKLEVIYLFVLHKYYPLVNALLGLGLETNFQLVKTPKSPAIKSFKWLHQQIYFRMIPFGGRKEQVMHYIQRSIQ